MKNIFLWIIVVIALMVSRNSAQIIDQTKSKNSKIASGLVFEKEVEYRVADSTYTNVIQLLKLTEKAQALQFRILLNKSDDDKEILKFREIQKGSDLKDPSWLLDYNIVKGSDAANDEVYVVLYNSNLEGGIPPGDYYDFIRVSYEVSNSKKSDQEVKSSIRISHAQASTFNGFPIMVDPSRDELKIFVRSK